MDAFRAAVEARDLRSVEDLLHDDAGGAYVFTATVDDLELTGCDFLRLDAEGRITDFMVMVRPLRAAQALAARMAERYPRIVEAAAAWAPRAD